jgi:hypothetical protein
LARTRKSACAGGGDPKTCILFGERHLVGHSMPMGNAIFDAFYIGDDPKKNMDKHVAQIEKDYANVKVMAYRKDIEKSKTEKHALGELPWPLCISFNCCKMKKTNAMHRPRS